MAAALMNACASTGPRYAARKLAKAVTKINGQGRSKAPQADVQAFERMLRMASGSASVSCLTQGYLDAISEV